MSFQDKARPVTTTSGAPSFASKIKPVRKEGAPTFAVPEPANYRENRIEQFQAEASQSQAEAEKANSFMGMTKAFGKAFIKNIAPSQVGLGKSIGNILYANSKENKNLQDTISQGEDIKVNLLKTIREQEAQGKDTTRLKQAYNAQEKNVADTTRTARDLVQLPSTAKVAGQLGGTALDLLTAGTYGKAKTAAMGTGRLVTASPAVKTAATAVGVPELGAIAGQKAAGLFSLKGAGNIAKGAGIGYASDVALGLSGERGAEREGAAAFIPGLGTALGAAIPAVSETAQTVKNIRNPEVLISEKRMKALRDLETKNVKIATVFDAADRKGIDVRKTLAETNLLNGAISPDGRISSDKALSNFNEFIQPYEGQVKDALEKEGRSVQINQLVNDAKDFINQSTLSDRQKVELQQELAGQLDAFSQFRGKAVPVTALHDTKVTLANSNNYLNPGKNIVDKEAARFFKDLVERNTSSMDVAKYNGELSKYYTVREALEKMDRAVVNGGRMGKYFSSLIGSGVGGLAGGPVGAIVGAEVGAKTRGGMMSRAFGGDIKTGLTPTSDLLGALKPKATGKAAIPDVTIPRTSPKIPDVVMPSFKKGAIPLTTKANIPVRKPMEKLVGVKKSTETKPASPARVAGISKIIGSTKTPIDLKTAVASAKSAEDFASILTGEKLAPIAKNLNDKLDAAVAKGQTFPTEASIEKAFPKEYAADKAARENQNKLLDEFRSTIAEKTGKDKAFIMQRPDKQTIIASFDDLKSTLKLKQRATTKGAVNPKLEAYRSGKPSREGGYIANPLAALASKQKDNQVGSLSNATTKLAEQQVEKVTSALNDFDTTPLTVKEAGKTRIETGNVDDMVRLDELKTIQDKKPLTNAQVAEAEALLKRNGGIVDIKSPTTLLEETPETVKVFIKSKFSDGGAMTDVPVIRREDNITLYQGGFADGRQFWTPNKKYASQFGDVKEKTGSFYKVDNGNRVTDVYVEVPNKESTLLEEAKKYKSAEELSIGGGTPVSTTLANFIGKNAKTFDTSASFEALDGMVRNQINASLKMKPLFDDIVENRATGNKSWAQFVPLRELIDYPELFTAYPSAKNIRVSFMDMGKNDFGSFYLDDRGVPTINLNRSKQVATQTLKHEIQHFIQAKEGFSLGGNPDVLFRADVQNQVLKQQLRNVMRDKEIYRSSTIGDMEYIKSAIEKTGRGEKLTTKEIEDFFGDEKEFNGLAMKTYKHLHGEWEAEANSIEELLKVKSPIFGKSKK
jgi:hypothetical protein